MRPLVMRGFALLLVVMVLPLGCAKRPVIYRDPSFNRKAIMGRAAAFILPDSIDIAPVVQEFVTAFDGDPTDGIQWLQTCLWDCLTGKEMTSTPGPSSKQIRLRLVDLSELVDPGQALRLLKFETDRYGVMNVSVTSPDTLAALLAKCNITHLVIFGSLAVSRQPGKYTRGVLAIVPGPAEIHIASQCFVWSRGTMALVWSGYVNGWSSGVNERALRQLANSFAYDLWAVME